MINCAWLSADLLNKVVLLPIRIIFNANMEKLSLMEKIYKWSHCWRNLSKKISFACLPLSYRTRWKMMNFDYIMMQTFITSKEELSLRVNILYTNCINLSLKALYCSSLLLAGRTHRCVQWPGLGYPPYCPPWGTPGSYKLSSAAGCGWWRWLKQQIPGRTSHRPLGQEMVYSSMYRKWQCVVILCYCVSQWATRVQAVMFKSLKYAKLCNNAKWQLL